MEVIEQMTYLLFIKRLDELERLKEKKASRTGVVENPIFNKRQQKLRRSCARSSALYRSGLDPNAPLTPARAFATIPTRSRRLQLLFQGHQCKA